MASRYIAQHGPDDGYHITVERAFDPEGFRIVIWSRNHGSGVSGTVREQSKAEGIATYLYDNLLPEYEAEQEYWKKETAKFEAKRAQQPKPKPPKIPKNAPILEVLECSECNHLMLPEDVSDERVYECGECGTTGTGEDGRRCEQCNKFTAKIADISCPECGAGMDEAETVQAQKATNGELVKAK